MQQLWELLPPSLAGAGSGGGGGTRAPAARRGAPAHKGAAGAGGAGGLVAHQAGVDAVCDPKELQGQEDRRTREGSVATALSDS